MNVRSDVEQLITQFYEGAYGHYMCEMASPGKKLALAFVQEAYDIVWEGSRKTDPKIGTKKLAEQMQVFLTCKVGENHIDGPTARYEWHKSTHHLIQLREEYRDIVPWRFLQSLTYWTHNGASLDGGLVFWKELKTYAPRGEVVCFGEFSAGHIEPHVSILRMWSDRGGFGPSVDDLVGDHLFLTFTHNEP